MQEMKFEECKFEVVDNTDGRVRIRCTHTPTGRYNEILASEYYHENYATQKAYRGLCDMYNDFLYISSFDLEEAKFKVTCIDKNDAKVGYGSADSLVEAEQDAYADCVEYCIRPGTLTNLTFCASTMVKVNRDAGAILRSLMSEVGELAQEVDVHHGTTYKTADEDGILGEAVDVILCALDLIKVTHPEITEQELCQVAVKKIDKWLTLTGSK